MEERVEETFAVNGTPCLKVSNVRGSITVRGEEREDVQVTAVKHLDSKHAELTEVQVYQQGNCVIAKTHYLHDGQWLDKLRGSRVCLVDYTVLVPLNCEVRVNQVQGTVWVSAVNGQVKVNAVQGDVELHEIAGRTRVHAVSASVQGEGWSGRAEVDTVSGAVEITGAQLSRFKGNTVSGSLELNMTLDDAGRYDFNSVSGDVTLYLPPGRGVESRGTSISGKLWSDLPHEYSRRSRGSWQATINGGGPAVRFHSVSGDLEVLSAGA
jgi:DUF4097 and DUF4098 domain-containing protein YvlB